jgi:uncharacterized membrane protein YphA (DoxX/SURF4 family)
MKDSKFWTILRYAHAAATIALAIFFIMKGYEKFGEPKLRLKNVTIENKEQIVQQIIEEQNYEAPFGYDITMNTMRQSGFIKFIGLFQILSGLLMFIPNTRMAGLLMLLPIILNIFLMHVFFDNRPHENIETGRLLAATVILLLFYWKSLLQILWRKTA